MKYDKKSNDYVLSTGKRFYANNGILGLAVDKSGEAECRCDELSHGYDGGFLHFREEGCVFSAEERREIAEAMVERWREWGGV